MSESIHLKKDEIRAAFTQELREEFPPFMDVKAVARMLGKSPKIIHNWWEAGRLKGTGRRQGKCLFFWRDRVIDKIFNGPDWVSQSNDKEEVHAVK